MASQGIRLSSVALDGDAVYWIEGRPHEAGRNVLVRRAPDGTTRDVTPGGFNTRSRVHEYGGGAYLADGRHVYFVNFIDQRVYALDLEDAASPTQPTPLTPEGAFCHGDFTLDRTHRRLIGIREDHTVAGREAVTDARRHPARRRRDARAGLERRLLLHSAHRPDGQEPVLAVVDASAHALGRHGAVGRANRQRGRSW